MEKIFTILYTSQATSVMKDNDVYQILEVSKKNNSRDNITGFLVFRDSYFLQLLEGPEDKVRRCMKRIHQDPRSTNITIQGELFSDERIMNNWSMALVSPQDLHSSSNEILNLFELGRQGERYSGKKSILGLIRYFAKDAKILK